MALNYNETWNDLSIFDTKKLFNSGGMMIDKEKNIKTIDKYTKFFDFSSEYINTLLAKNVKPDKFYKENYQILLSNYNNNPTRENFILFKREFHKKKDKCNSTLIPELIKGKLNIKNE